MRISEVLGDTYDLLFSFNPVNDNNKKLKISFKNSVSFIIIHN